MGDSLEAALGPVLLKIARVRWVALITQLGCPGFGVRQIKARFHQYPVPNVLVLLAKCQRRVPTLHQCGQP